MPFTEVDAAHYLGQVLRRQLWQEQSLFYSGKSSKSTVQITIFIHLVNRSLFILRTFGIYTAGRGKTVRMIAVLKRDVVSNRN